MKKLLENKGYKVVMIRTGNNKVVSCVQRSKIANKAKSFLIVF